MIEGASYKNISTAQPSHLLLTDELSLHKHMVLLSVDCTAVSLALTWFGRHGLGLYSGVDTGRGGTTLRSLLSWGTLYELLWLWWNEGWEDGCWTDTVRTGRIWNLVWVVWAGGKGWRWGRWSVDSTAATTPAGTWQRTTRLVRLAIRQEAVLDNQTGLEVWLNVLAITR